MTSFPRHDCRGAALAETSAVLAFTLVTLFGMLQLVLIGYLQVAGDAAVFFAAHWYTLGVTQATIASNVTNLVPPLISNAITYSPAPPPSVDPSPFNAMYGSNLQSSGQNARTGGFTLVRPQNYSVYLNQNSGAGATAAWSMSGIFGYHKEPITSGGVEGYYLMTQNQMDNLGGGPNDYETSNILNPDYASPFLPSSDAVIANMNTPPYYVPTTFSMLCGDTWAGGGSGGQFGSHSFGQACSDPQPWYYGTAGFLSNYNYAPSGGAMGVNYGQVFAAMALHQRIFVNLIPAFPYLPSDGAGGTGDTTLKSVAQNIQSGVSTVPSGFNNGNSSCGTPTVPLSWYDQLGWWEQNGITTTYAYNSRLPFSIRHFGGFGSNPTQTLTSNAGGNADGPAGPNCTNGIGSWNGASFALVYFWDQPGIPDNIGVGYAPTHPYAGGMSSGDPGY